MRLTPGFLMGVHKLWQTYILTRTVSAVPWRQILLQGAWVGNPPIGDTNVFRGVWPEFQNVCACAGANFIFFPRQAIPNTGSS